MGVALNVLVKSASFSYGFVLKNAAVGRHHDVLLALVATFNSSDSTFFAWLFFSEYCR
jgi:hypothetical protein